MLVHRRLWPALVRLAKRFPKDRLAAVRDEHTSRGSHRAVATPFPRWVPRQILDEAALLDEDEAIAALKANLSYLTRKPSSSRSG